MGAVQGALPEVDAYIHKLAGELFPLHVRFIDQTTEDVSSIDRNINRVTIVMTVICTAFVGALVGYFGMEFARSRKSRERRELLAAAPDPNLSSKSSSSSISAS